MKSQSGQEVKGGQVDQGGLSGLGKKASYVIYYFYRLTFVKPVNRKFVYCCYWGPLG